MDDQFLYDLRENPSPEFADRLRRKLNAQAASELRTHSPIWRRPAVVALSAAAALLIALSFPAVRTVAQQFLDLFRVQRFVAVSADPERLKQIARIANEGFDVKSLLSRNVKVVKKPTERQLVESVAAAEQLTGVVVQLPATLPREVVQEEMFVVRERGSLGVYRRHSLAAGRLGRAGSARRGGASATERRCRQGPHAATSDHEVPAQWHGPGILVQAASPGDFFAARCASA